jgi:hypothetical protein
MREGLVAIRAGLDYDPEQKQELLLALQSLDARLRTDPLGFGEEKFHYHGLELQLRIGIQFPWVVHFAVHDEQPLVFVKKPKLLPGNG